jgi:hypothetical protein
MVMLYAVPVAILLGYLRGGRLTNLNNIELKAAWLVFVALVIQMLIFPIGLGDPFIHPDTGLTEYLHIGSYVLLALFVALNWSQWGILLMGLGMFSNIAVITANGGYMPTTAEKLTCANLKSAEQAALLQPGDTIANNIIIGESTRLTFLGDIFCIPPIIPLSNVFSIGDAILALGLVLYISAKMKSQPADPPV